MDRVPLLYNGCVAGELTVERETLYLRFSAVCRLKEDRLWCIWAIGEQGELRLGIPEPSGGSLVLCRRFSGQMTAPLGRILRGEVRPVQRGEGEGWQAAACPEKLFRTPWLCRQMRGAAGILTKGTAKMRRVAIPYAPGQPFPLTAMFCFARICRIGERQYAVYCFDEREWPVLPEKN